MRGGGWIYILEVLKFGHVRRRRRDGMLLLEQCAEVWGISSLAWMGVGRW